MTALDVHGTQAAAGMLDGRILLGDLETKACTVLHAHEKTILCVAYSADGKWLFSGGFDRRLARTSVLNWKVIELRDAMGWVHSISVTRDGRCYAAVETGTKGLVTAWDYEANAAIDPVVETGARVTRLVVSQDSRLLIVRRSPDSVVCFGLTDREPKRDLGCGVLGPEILEMAPNGAWLLIGESDYWRKSPKSPWYIQRLDFKTLKQAGGIDVDRPWGIVSAKFTPNSAFLLVWSVSDYTTSRGRQISRLDVVSMNTMQTVHTQIFPMLIAGSAFSGEGDKLIVAGGYAGEKGFVGAIDVAQLGIGNAKVSSSEQEDSSCPKRENVKNASRERH